MPLGRGVKMGLAEPVDFLSEEELVLRGTKTGLATPVYVINADDFSGGGTGDDLTYVHNQIVPSSTWVITHNLNKFPSVTIVDSAGTVVIGDVTHNSNDQVTVTFNSAFAGRAYLN